MSAAKRAFTVHYKESVQISPDDWDVHSVVLQVTENTTVGEIREWAKTTAVRPHQCYICHFSDKWKGNRECVIKGCGKHPEYKMREIHIVEHDTVAGMEGSHEG